MYVVVGSDGVDNVHVCASARHELVTDTTQPKTLHVPFNEAKATVLQIANVLRSLCPLICVASGMLVLLVYCTGVGCDACAGTQ